MLHYMYFNLWQILVQFFQVFCENITLVKIRKIINEIFEIYDLEDRDEKQSWQKLTMDGDSTKWRALYGCQGQHKKAGSSWLPRTTQKGRLYKSACPAGKVKPGTNVRERTACCRLFNWSVHLSRIYFFKLREGLVYFSVKPYQSQNPMVPPW